MRAGAGDSNDLGAALSAQNDVGAYLLDAEHRAGGSEVQASASGSFAFMAKQIFVSRRIDSSFAVARVPDRADVRIYSDNQLVGRTTDEGYALLPGLRAYQNNQIRIEQADLPLDVAIGTTQLNAVPYYRSGLLLSFPVNSPHGALISVVLESGEPLPAGALVRLEGVEEAFPTGLEGQVYVTGLEDSNRLRVEYRNQSCELVVPYTASADPLPRLGPFVCTGVKP
jgi:outer membrane usher protein